MHISNTMFYSKIRLCLHGFITRETEDMTSSPVSEYSEQLMFTGLYGGFSGFLGTEHGMVLMMRMQCTVELGAD